MSIEEMRDLFVTMSSSNIVSLPGSAGLLLALIGALIILSALLRRGMETLSLPAMTGYLVLGACIAYLNAAWPFLDQNAFQSLEFLASAGMAVLLFRIGQEIDFLRLIVQIRRVGLIWLSEILVSFTAGFFAAHQLLGFELVPSLVVATALSTTSLGVALVIWRNARVLESDTGTILKDLGGIDHLSGVVLLALFSGLILLLQPGQSIDAAQIAMATIASLLKFLLFCGLCVLFVHYLRRPLTAWFSELKPQPPVIVLVAAFAFIIIAIAGALGFSLAIGAFFAGAAFGRDSLDHKFDGEFAFLFALLVPFFFIDLGLGIDFSILGHGIVVGLVLLLFAVISKLVGVSVATRMVTGRGAALLVGMSLVPRGEIAMVVIHQAKSFGQWAIVPQLYIGMIVVFLLTCLVVPIVLESLLQRFSPDGVT